MVNLKKIVFFAGIFAFGLLAFAQDAEDAEAEEAAGTPPPPISVTSETPSFDESKLSKLLLTPLNSSDIWTMGDSIQAKTDMDRLEIAKNPAAATGVDKDGKPKERPVPNSVYFGVPPKSTSSIISLGTNGNDVDRFFSTTAFSETSYNGAFGFFGFDNNSLSAGVSRKFNTGAVASLYYNGNIVEDIFAYIANNSLTNGAVSLEAQDGITGTDYDFMGDLKDRNNINSRNNVGILFGAGGFGISIGYSQKLFGLVRKSDAQPQRVGSTASAAISNMQEAMLDNALVPQLELGFRAEGKKAVFKTSLAFQVDIHQHRELSKGQIITLANYYPPAGTQSYTVSSNVTDKLSADYIEPAVTFKFETDFPSDNRSQLALGLEVGGGLKMYSNLDDKAEAVNGIFWSEDTGAGVTSAYYNSVTEKPLDLEVRARPSVRYITRIGKRFKVGLNGGFGVGFKFGETTTKTYGWTNKGDFMTDSDPYNDGNLVDLSTSGYNPVVKTLPALDLALYPNLGVGFAIDIVPNVFTLNGGVGAVQTLYRIRTGEIEIDDGTGTKVKTPLFEQNWGKPLAQLALGAAFNFKSNFSLDAMFSTNGTSLDNANFAVQVKASF
jgi:hypothetical protein